MKTLMKALASFCAHPRIAALAVLLAIVLTLPVMRNGFCLDDNYHRLIFKGERQYVSTAASPLNLFCFQSGQPGDGLMRSHFWAFPDRAKIYFFRPLSALSHCLDYLLWPDSPALMYAHSIFWLAVVVGCAALFYRQIMGPEWAAGCAALFFSLNYAHGAIAGFLANRNALLSAAFGLICLICHHKWQSSQQTATAKILHTAQPWRAALGPFFFLLSLLSAEAGIAVCAYLGAHALFLD
jgi:hypothetical protein